MQKCIFASHFPKENVQLCKNAFDAKMHLMRCQNAFLHQMHFCNAYILRSKMFSITFSKGKCSATLCKNAFDAKMHLMQKCCVFCFAKNKDAALTFCLQKVRKAFDAKMHLMQKCIFATQRVHFPKENVQQRCAKMHFCITFSFVKCSASHFTK